ncbi:LOW QUALITY PROTEIN: hypothetical protein U9M48_031154 [Paspalum notatum var. saurae]|uniref:NB-ARC domain-containing protein n=1 Tax=Paspalum notatum var. saurae TaxID=547442 RepID=A0AAQ3U588_PASNO
MEVFPKPSEAQGQATTVVEDQIKEMIHKVTEMVQQLQEAPANHTKILEDVSTETKQKIDQIKWRVEEQMQIKWLVDKIEERLDEDTLMLILRIDDQIYESSWEENRYALNLLRWQVPGVLIITNTESIQKAKDYCYPPQRKPIEYSLVGLYHDTVLKLTSQHKNDGNSSSEIIHNILEECEDHEFCMRIFTHALHANPMRSNEELHKLHHTLQEVSKKSFNSTTENCRRDSLAKKMIKFSYSDLSKEYKSCLLYLAIFPPGHNVRRSTLIGRWIVEGLITKEDWPTSVHQAEQCFDALVDRMLVNPGHIGATGKIKSCSVGHLVHGFITKIARKQHIVLTRLSLHLARHFSIFNDVHLGSSDNIHKFFKKLPESSPWSRLKVLDLEGCRCFSGKNQHYLKDICNKILLLKYLSLRGTDVSNLPVEMNNLRISTEMHASATKHLVLLKLKCLLAGHTDLIPGMAKEFFSVRVPKKIEKMVNMEVLSNVKASQNGHELKDIRKLWQLRKLDVAPQEFDSGGDLHECLRSLSITLLPITSHEGTTCSGLILLGNTSSSGSPAADNGFSLKHPPKVLESLSISGTTQKVQLLQTLLAEDENQLAKVTLSSTELNQDGFNSLAKLPKLRCLKLRHITYTESKLTFNEDKFKCLEYFLTESCNMTGIFFENGAAPELEKITLRFTNLQSLSGVEDLPKLKELEVNSNNKSSSSSMATNEDSNNMLHSFLDRAIQIAKVTLRGTLLKQGDFQKLSKKSNIRCLELLDKSCDESQLTFNKAEFLKLNHLIVNCSKITKINFTSGSTPKLEKFIWAFTNMQSLSGIDSLPRLREIELIGDFVPNEVKESINKNKNKPYVTYYK